MNRTKHTITALLCSLALTAGHAQAQQQAFVVQGVEDGDTLIVEISGEKARLQLTGIDAPEDVMNPKLQKDMERTGLDAGTLLQLGQAATAHLASLVPVGARVTVEGQLEKRDRYGRIPAIVHSASGASVNETMVATGYAVVLGRYPMEPGLKARLLDMQKNAVEQKRGLWGSHPQTTHSWSGL